jgi:hypothetical protein
LLCRHVQQLGPTALPCLDAIRAAAAVSCDATSPTAKLLLQHKLSWKYSIGCWAACCVCTRVCALQCSLWRFCDRLSVCARAYVHCSVVCGGSVTGYFFLSSNWRDSSFVCSLVWKNLFLSRMHSSTVRFSYLRILWFRATALITTTAVRRLYAVDAFTFGSVKHYLNLQDIMIYLYNQTDTNYAHEWSCLRELFALLRFLKLSVGIIIRVWITLKLRITNE